jgi:Astacin (Peptidase family M12A)
MEKRLLLLCLSGIVLFACKKEKADIARPEEKIANTGPNAWDLFFSKTTPQEIVKISRGGKDIYLEKRGNSYTLEGDMLFTQEEVDLLRKESAPKKDSNARAINADVVKLWPGATVPYTVNSNVAAGAISMINTAISDWAASTPVRFVPRTTQADYVEFTAATVNDSHVGRQGGKQIVNFVQTNSSPVVVRALTHEIGHAIGLFHEQSRVDRDNFININWGNIKPGKEHNFKTYLEDGKNGIDLQTFDFNSIMLYPSVIGDPDFVYNTTIPTLTRKDGTVFGQGNFLSAGDVFSANYMYNAPYVGLEEIVEIDNYSADMYSYSVHREGQIRLRFFSDAARTIPYVLQYPIKLKVYNIYQYQGSGGGQATSYVTVPAGQTSLILGRYLNILSVDYGVVLYSESENVGVDPYVGYINP